MKPIPLFALKGDVAHGPGQTKSWDAWWSALALGADGLACHIAWRDAAWRVDTADPKGQRVDEFVYIFGAACPLLLVMPPDSPPVEDAALKALEALLVGAALAFAPTLVVNASQYSTFSLLSPVQLYVHTTTGTRAFPKQAWPTRPAQALDEALYLWLLDVPASGAPVVVARCTAQHGDDSPWPNPARVLCETFDVAQAEAVHARWALGYSNLHRESFLSLQPGAAGGLCIEMVAGKQYSGGGAVLRQPVQGDFDLQVDFADTAPAQGSTLELAVITIDPPLYRRAAELDRAKLTHLDTSPVFDVHGTPPYVSAECDEADGYRMGWNRSYTLTRTLDEPWMAPDGQLAMAPVARSDNLYNRYGRDVGPKPEAGKPATGTLRLVRKGSIFASYFRATAQDDWQCSGTQCNPNMPPQLYVRLAAKHWLKAGLTRAPARTVRFFNFCWYQPAWS